MDDILVPIALFAIILGIFWIVYHHRSKNHARTVELLSQMIERGDSITPETTRAMGVQSTNPHRDLKIGLVLIAIALAMVVFGANVPDPSEDAQSVVAGLASFPFLVGLVYCFFWLAFGRKAAKA